MAFLNSDNRMSPMHFEVFAFNESGDEVSVGLVEANDFSQALEKAKYLGALHICDLVKINAGLYCESRAVSTH